jgi:hypothetical protein
MKYPPDYELSYIESTVEALNLRGLIITPSAVLQGLWMIEARGLEDADAETSLYVFLYRLTPFHAGHLEPTWFQGWEALANELAAASLEELAHRFGYDAVRVAEIIRWHFLSRTS